MDEKNSMDDLNTSIKNFNSYLESIGKSVEELTKIIESLNNESNTNLDITTNDNSESNQTEKDLHEAENVMYYVIMKKLDERYENYITILEHKDYMIKTLIEEYNLNNTNNKIYIYLQQKFDLYYNQLKRQADERHAVYLRKQRIEIEIAEWIIIIGAILFFLDII